MRALVKAGVCCALIGVGACASGPRVVPAGGQEQAQAAAGGATITVVDQEWEGSPDDLAEYVTPVPVELANSGPYEVRVSYFDFALVDEAGFRYKALNPFVPARTDATPATGDAAVAQAPAPRPARDPALARLLALDDRDAATVLLAGPGVRLGAPRAGPSAPRVHMGGYGHFGGYARPPAFAPHAPLPGRAPSWMGWRAGYGYGGWRGYRVYPSYRPWLGAGFGAYWDSPFYWPPGYATWVVGWGPAWYPPSPTVPQDVVNLGLPEGVLQSGGRVAGYLYFQRRQPNTRRLTLTWDLHEARQGAPLGSAQILLDVVQ